MRFFAWVSLALLLAAYICRPIADPDLWWHITVGRWIVAHHDVPVIDHWNMFGVGQPWRAYSWSNEVVYALVDTFLGERGLIAAQLALAVVLALAMQYSLGAIAGNHIIGALLGGYATASFHAHFSLRPQTVVWILFAFCILLADRVRRTYFSKLDGVAALILGCSWANTHLSAAIGLLTLLVWSGASANGRSARMRVLLITAGFFVGTLLTPYLGGEWITFFEKSDHMARFSAIDEFRPATLLQHSTGMLLVESLLLALLCFFSRVVCPRGPLLLTGFLLVLGLGFVKFLPFAAISISALLAVWWRDSAARRTSEGLMQPLEHGVVFAERLLRGLHPQTLGALGFFMCCLAWINAARSIRQPVNEVMVPKEGVAFINDNSLPHPVLGDMGIGGFLMYSWSSAEGEPQHLTVLDGRTNVNSEVLWRELQYAFSGREGWSQGIERVNPQTILWRNGSPLVTLLLESDAWCRVFVSGKSVQDVSVFVRRDFFEARRSSLRSEDCQ